MKNFNFNKREKEGENWEKRQKDGKSGRKGKNQEGSFTLPLLTDRDDYWLNRDHRINEWKW